MGALVEVWRSGRLEEKALTGEWEPALWRVPGGRHRSLGSVLIGLTLLAGSGAAQTVAFQEDSSTLADFRLAGGTPEKNYIVEATAGGVCLLDFDRDGDLDIYLVNGGELAAFRENRPSGLRNALFRNLGNRRFERVPGAAGAPGNGHWGMGCSAADYDGDGWVDLYLTTYGSNLLYRNLQGSGFQDVTGPAAADDPRWSTGSAWADFDRDGDLDLFVSNYIELDRTALPEPGSTRYGSMGNARQGCQFMGMDVMCGPRGLPGAGDSFFVNQGNGAFSEAAVRLGLHDPGGLYGLGAIWCDFDDDGWTDLYVANDSTPNFLYHNLEGKGFEELGLLSGTSASQQGLEQAGMGVACGDYLNEGLPALFVTNFSEEYNTLYRNEGDFNFSDVTERSGTARPALPFVGWGVVFQDVDNDGWLDLFIANGHVFPSVDRLDTQAVASYRQRNLLFVNQTGGRFREVGEAAGLSRRESSRGAAGGDLDGDGLLDIVVNNLDAVPTILWNRTPGENHFLTLDLRLTSGAPAVGARVRLRAGDLTMRGEVQAGGSYLSQGDPRLHFGLGPNLAASEIEIRWPDGSITSLQAVSADQILQRTATAN